MYQSNMSHPTKVLPILKVRRVIVIGIGFLFKGYLIICLYPVTSRLNKSNKKFANIPQIEAYIKHLTALSNMYALMINCSLAQRFAL